MIHISEPLDKVMIDITVKAMLNPDNPDFYIGSLTLDKIASLFAEMDNPSADVVTLFWKAFHIANAKYKEQQEELEHAYDKDVALDDIAYEFGKHRNNSYYGNPCPNCGCTATLGYIPGVRCPNCDYIEE